MAKVLGQQYFCAIRRPSSSTLKRSCLEPQDYSSFACPIDVVERSRSNEIPGQSSGL
jgi:hypothetical protein